MALPITGPLIETYRTGIGVGSRWVSRDRYRQALPYNLPLLYRLDSRYVGVDVGSGSEASKTNTHDPGTYGTRSPYRVGDFPSRMVDSARNRARSNLKSNIADDATWMATLLEGRKALAMISRRLTEAGHIIRAVKRGDVGGMITWLRQAASDDVAQAAAVRASKARRAGASVGNTMLEVMFGWMPTISDIQSSAELLSTDFAPRSVEGYGKSVNTITGGGSLSFSWWTVRHECWVKVKCGCDVSITNPNLYLASKMGLINPFSALWEVVPWSFVVDYFVNVGQFIESFTEGLGLEMTNLYTRERYYDFCTYSHHVENNQHVEIGSYTTGISSQNARGTRTVPAVTLARKSVTLSKERALTSASLLLQQLNRL